MLLLFLFGVITSIATVTGSPVDFDQGEYSVEGFIPNDLPVDDTGMGSSSNELPTYVYPDSLNPDSLGEMRDKADIDSFRPLADEPITETTDKPTQEPNNDPNSQLSDQPIINLIGESSSFYILISKYSNSVDLEFDNSATLSSSCNQFFGLACCTGGSYELINIESDEPLHLQDVSGCSARMRSI